MYSVTSPVDGSVLKEFATQTDQEIESSIAEAHQEYLRWSKLPIEERAKKVKRIAELFSERAEDFAQIMTREIGKRIGDARGEMGVVVDIFSYYADNAERLLADETFPIVGGQGIIRKGPIGVVLGIMPWNYPVYQVARFAAPNLVLGNTALLKHAPICPETALAIATLIHDAGVPQGAYLNLFATNDQIADVIADPRVQGVSLTGSERAGAAVAEIAGKNLKKVVLELGGSDPMVILDSLDISSLARVATDVRLENMGQACNAPKRMIVMEDIYPSFVTELVKNFKDFTPGNPVDEATTLAPLSSRAAAEKVAAQVARAKEQGATIECGGHLIEGPGNYFEATVITGLTPEMDIHHEEVFGPVAIVYSASDEDQALDLANDTPFGLGSSVFSTDPQRAMKFGRRIESGMVYVNNVGGSQADMPFGGVKRSGIGRELGYLGIEEFMNKQAIRVLDE